MNTDERPYQVRQGDLLIVRVEGLPKRARHRRGAKARVLAEGEATGHAHVLEPAAAGQADVLELGGRLLARILGGDARVVHPEHAPVVLPPGAYEIVRQREFVPTAADMPERFARVRD